ncbi:Fic/DOC family protein [Arthrobacter sp. TMN-49]
MSSPHPWETGDERERWNGYLDPDTGILRNLVNARTGEQLRVREDDFVEFRTMQLRQRPITGNFDLTHVQAIHQQLFQDVYPWAGNIRTVNIVKGQPFAQRENIQPFTQHLAAEISASNRLRGVSSEQFAHQLAGFYNQLNDIHPFREGNGRTQRTFWDQLAADAGKSIGWREVHGQENDLASMEGRTGNLAPLHSMFQQIVTDK